MVADEEEKEEGDGETTIGADGCGGKKENADRGEKAPVPNDNPTLFSGIVSSFCPGCAFQHVSRENLD